MEKGFIGTVLGAILVVALTYVLLSRSAAVKEVSSSAVGNYGKVAKTFQGGG